MVKIMMKDYFYLSKLMHEAMYDALEFFTEEQIQKLLNKQGQFKVTYENVEQQVIAPSKPEQKETQKVEKESTVKPKEKQKVVAEKKEVKNEVTKIKEVKETKEAKEEKPKTSKQKTESVTVDTSFEEKTIVSKLNTFESESEARKYLNDLKLNKTQLQTLLGYCKIPVPKSSTISDMKKRLVDSEVSSRLRTSVIQNTNVGSRK